MANKYTLLTLLAPILWGTTYFVTTQYMPPDKPLLLGALRALLASLLLMLFIRKWPSRKWFPKILWLSLFNIFLFFALFFYAAYRLPGGVAATLGAFNPFFVTLFAWPLLHQKPKKHTLLAAFLGITGVAMLVLSPNEKLDWLGVAAALAATLAIAPGTVLTKKWGLPTSPLAAATWQMLFAGIALLIISMIFETPFPHFNNKSIAGAVYLSFAATGLAYIVWFYGLEKIKPHMAAVLTLSTPIVAVLIDYFLLDKNLSVKQIIGGCIILGAIIFETYKEGQASKKQD